MEKMEMEKKMDIRRLRLILMVNVTCKTLDTKQASKEEINEIDR